MVFVVFQIRNDTVLNQHCDNKMKKREEIKNNKNQQNLTICIYISQNLTKSDWVNM